MAKTATVKQGAAIVFADAHLQRKTWRHRPIYGDAYFAWQQIFDYALEHGITDIFGLGDLFDQRINEPSPLAFAQEQFWRLFTAKRGHTLYYIQGQHELDDVRVLRTAETLGVARHIDGQVVELATGMRIYGMDYQPADRIQGALAAIPKGVDVLAAHQVWGDFMGDIALPQADFAHIPVVKQLWTGDYHQWVCETKKYRGDDGRRLTVLSPGATHQCPDISSPPHGYFAVVRADGTLVPRELAGRRYEEWHLANNEELEAFLANVAVCLDTAAERAAYYHLPPELHTPLWRITHTSRLADAERRIDKVVAGRAHLFYKEIRAATTPDGTAPLIAPSAGTVATLDNCLAEEVDPQQHPAVFALCQRLLAAGAGKDAAAQTLAAWKQEVLDATE